MSAKIIDGRALADKIKREITEKTKTAENLKETPGLGFILVGNDPASQTYVRMKGKACQKVGFHSSTKEFPANISQTELLRQIRKFNDDPHIHGFLVQLPLPEHIDENAVIEAVSPTKDVDCFHPFNVGLLQTGKELFAPCTPAGVVELLLQNGYDPAGKHVVIIGRSSIVGRPLATLLSRKSAGGNATVTLCHSRTPDIVKFTRQADIVIAAVGSAELITGGMLKPGCVVIDVGTNRVSVPQPEDKRGYRIMGDVHFASASEVAEAITPVPGGVGPMTIAMLLKNTLKAAQLSL